MYLERLVEQQVVTKANRRLSMATCLVLAFKFNEPIYLTQTQQLAQQNEHSNSNSSSNTGTGTHEETHDHSQQQQQQQQATEHGGGDNSRSDKDPRFKRLLDFFENEWSLSPEEVNKDSAVGRRRVGGRGRN